MPQIAPNQELAQAQRVGGNATTIPPFKPNLNPRKNGYSVRRPGSYLAAMQFALFTRGSCKTRQAEQPVKGDKTKRKRSV